MKRIPYNLPYPGNDKKIILKNWNDVFKLGSDISLAVLNTGCLICPINRLINLKHPNTRDLKLGSVKIPVLAFLIRHPKAGNYLIDTGLDSSFQTNPMGRTRGLLAKKLMPPGTQEKDQNIAFYLKKENINLTAVFLSHLHMDHMAGVRDLPGDILYVIPKGEKEITVFPFAYDDYLKGIDTLYELDIKQGSALPPFDHCVDIFRDASLFAISTPGHTKKHISFFVNRKDKPAFITADACHFKLCIERKTGPGAFTADVKAAQQSLMKIIDFSEQYGNVEIICGHSLN